MIENGSYVREGQVLFKLFSDRDLFLDAKFLESDFMLLKNNQKCEVQPVSFERPYNAVLTELNPVVDQNGLFNARLKIMEGEGLILGMNATAAIHIPGVKSILVPKDAVSFPESRSI